VCVCVCVCARHPSHTHTQRNCHHQESAIFAVGLTHTEIVISQPCLQASLTHSHAKKLNTTRKVSSMAAPWSSTSAVGLVHRAGMRNTAPGITIEAIKPNCVRMHVKEICRQAVGGEQERSRARHSLHATLRHTSILYQNTTFLSVCTRKQREGKIKGGYLTKAKHLKDVLLALKTNHCITRLSCLCVDSHREKSRHNLQCENFY